MATTCHFVDAFNYE